MINIRNWSTHYLNDQNADITARIRCLIRSQLLTGKGHEVSVITEENAIPNHLSTIFEYYITP